MKRNSQSRCQNLFIKKAIFLISLFIISSNLYALSVTINGPSQVCPEQQYTFNSTVKNIFGTTITACSYNWQVMRNGLIIASSFSRVFFYTFDDTFGQVQIHLSVADGLNCISTATTSKAVTISLKTPDPIAGSSFICFGETKTYSTFLGENPADFDNCYFHHKYIWTLPPGWSITSQNPLSRSVNIKAPSTGTSGDYAIKVKGWYDDSRN